MEVLNESFLFLISKLRLLIAEGFIFNPMQIASLIIFATPFKSLLWDGAKSV